MSQNYTFMYCVSKYKQIIPKGIGLLGRVKSEMWRESEGKRKRDGGGS